MIVDTDLIKSARRTVFFMNPQTRANANLSGQKNHGLSCGFFSFWTFFWQKKRTLPPWKRFLKNSKKRHTYWISGDFWIKKRCLWSDKLGQELTIWPVTAKRGKETASFPFRKKGCFEKNVLTFSRSKSAKNEDQKRPKNQKTAIVSSP